MQPPITEKFVRSIDQIVVLRLREEVKSFRCLVEKVDVQLGPILLRHKDDRHRLVKATRVDFMSAAKKEAA